MRRVPEVRALCARARRPAIRFMIGMALIAPAGGFMARAEVEGWELERQVAAQTVAVENEARSAVAEAWRAKVLERERKKLSAQFAAVFDIPYDRIEVLMHRESIVHSMVEMVDGSFKAQLSWPDMRQPIQYALSYPERLDLDLPKVDFATMGKLHFGELDMERYPCLAIALEAGARGRTYPAAVAAADEEAVGAFLEGRIGFLDIARIVHATLEAHDPGDEAVLESVLEADAWARRFAVQWITEH